MQDGLFHSSSSQDLATPGEQRAWGMHETGYTFEAQWEDDAYLLPISRKRQPTLIESFMGLARRFKKH